MLQPCGDADLTLEAFGPEAGCEIVVQHLQCDGTIVLAVVGLVHGGHAAFADHAADLVALLERLDEADWSDGHRVSAIGAIDMMRW